MTKQEAIKKLEETIFNGNPIKVNIPLRKPDETEEQFKLRMAKKE